MAQAEADANSGRAVAKRWGGQMLAAASPSLAEGAGKFASSGLSTLLKFLAKKFFGIGGYNCAIGPSLDSVKFNSLRSAKEANAVPSEVEGGIRVSNREYLGPVYAQGFFVLLLVLLVRHIL